MEGKVGGSEAARQIVDVLMLCRDSHPHGRVGGPGCARRRRARGRAVAVLARRAQRPATVPLDGLDARLAATERPAPGLEDYDQLLAREQAR